MSLYDEFLGHETIEERIWRMHCEGKAPSEIAAELHVTEEAAHDVVVRRWAEDSESFGYQKPRR